VNNFYGYSFNSFHSIILKNEIALPRAMKRNLISMLDVKDDLEEIIDLAIQLKNKAKNGESIELLKGKTLGMLFEKSSTRTRVSFETGMQSFLVKMIYNLDEEKL